LQSTDLPVLMLALQAAHQFVTATPLPGQEIAPEELEDDGVLENGLPS
jgi:hypothetical protein